jgi:hypothetical protein
MMENREWEFSVVECGTCNTYYAQSKESHYPAEKILQADLTKVEALALLSLIGEPEKYSDDSYFVDIDN